MIVNEQGDVFQCDCGFSWRRGHSGSHDCAEGLRSQRDDLLAKMSEIDGCFEAALIEGWLDAVADEDISRIKDIYCRRIEYARSIAVAALEGGAA